MNLQPIVYVTDMEKAIAWYSQLLGTTPEVSGDHWTVYAIGGAHLALHLTDEHLEGGSVELSLVADEPLEHVAARLPTHRGIADEAFGRSLVMRDPDGTLIQVNEHDPDPGSG